MRKFLLPIINLVNVILVSIAFGLSANTAVVDGNEVAKGNYYQMVWGAAEKPNMLGIIGFFLFIVAALLTLICFLPLKGRKFLALLTGVAYVGTGALVLMTLKGWNYYIFEPEMTGSLIAMAVLIFCAGALSLVMGVIELSAKKEK